MEEPRWTLDELAERVETALAVDYHGQVSGRVRAVPDRRAIRWYTTIGLIDRPATHRGRTALYGPRHLLQLVAVKRLQARGLPLVSIQQELAGATDTQLARVARLPEGVAAGPVPAPASAAARAAAVPPRPVRSKARRTTFWRAQPAAFTAAAGADAITAEPAGLIPADSAALPDPTAPGREHAGSAPAATLRGIRLGDGATLLLEPGRELGSEDVQAILDAARPLLAALRERRLGAGGRDPGQDRQVADASELDPEAPRLRAGGNEPRREHP